MSADLRHLRIKLDPTCNGMPYPDQPAYARAGRRR
jgi:hypothetical protein